MADLRAQALAGFLERAAATPFAWGQADCCLMLADWLVALGRPDPAAHLRGTYASEDACARLVARAGGVAALVADCARRAGLAATDAPRAGDVGVVEAPTANGVRILGGLCLGRRWATRGAGLVVAERRVLAAWRVA